MRIHRVHLENFRGLEKQTLDFCDAEGKPRPFSVIVGPNMSGKTTALDALHLVYEGIGNFAAPKLRPEFEPNDPTLRTDPNQPIHVDVEFSLHDGEWEAIDALEKKLGHPGIATAKTKKYCVAFRWPAPADSFHGVLNNGTTPPRANCAFRGRSTARVAKARRLEGEKIFETVGGMLYLDQHRSVDLRLPSTRTGQEEALREEAGSRDVLPWLELISRLDQKWDTAVQGESAWRHVKRLYAQLAAPAEIDDIKAFDEGFDLRFRRGTRFYYSAGLSSGERQILRLVANLASFHARRSVVLIDELELHLHPRWQKNLVHFCRQGGDDDNQFIVTTHSESIVRYVDPADVISLGDL